MCILVSTKMYHNASVEETLFGCTTELRSLAGQGIVGK